MNSSQLLYKINSLEYSIARKKIEYESAVRNHNELGILSIKATLQQLKEDLVNTRLLFDTPPKEEIIIPPPVIKKDKWFSFFSKNKREK